MNEFSEFTSKFNDSNCLYFDWKSYSTEYKVYYYTISNLGKKSDNTYIEGTAQSSTEENNSWRFITKWVTPEQESKIVDYKEIYFILESYNKNGEKVASKSYNHVVDNKYTTYSSYSIDPSFEYKNNTLVIKAEGRNLDKGIVYIKDTKRNTDWKKIGAFNKGDLTSEVNTYKYSLTYQDTENYSYNCEIFISAENSYLGTVVMKTLTPIAKPVVPDANLSIASNVGSVAPSSNSVSVSTNTSVVLSLNSDYTEEMIYQWYVSDSSGSGYTAITGATNPTYTINTAYATSKKYYILQVTGKISKNKTGYSKVNNTETIHCNEIDVVIN